MADLNIPNLNKKSDKYLFKKKLTLRRKSKKNLIKESLLMFLLGILIIYLNYLVPNKINLFKNITFTFGKTLNLLNQLLPLLLEISIVFIIFVSLTFSIILFMGSFYRVIKVIKRKTKKISYK
tara:strand:+ start:994 stop:1362 length:369 start_codon:yes stop_codon:yes gene_type:complete